MCRLSETARRSNMQFLSKILIFALLTVTQGFLTHCLTINKLGPEIIAKTRVELESITVNAFLYDVIRISAPVINEEAVYYLHKPYGDAMKLDIKKPKLREMMMERDAQPIVARYFNNIKPIISQSNNYDAFSVYKRGLQPKEAFTKKLNEMEQNDFMIGPLTLEDHGNWVLSIYTKDFNDDWIELFQVITVTITDYVMLTPWRPLLKVGDTFNLRFVFPIPKLESCELVAPRSTFDRFYNRSKINLDNCGFTIPNVTERDQGVWRIVGVGQIVYEGETVLIVLNNGGNKTTASKPFINNSLNSNDYVLFL